MKIIGITGLKRSGKDTVAQILTDNFGFKRQAFAAPLKQGAAIFLGVSYDQCEGIGYDREQVLPEYGFSIRYFLQVLGTEGCRKLFRDDFWIIRAKKQLQVSMNEGVRGVVFSDVRFENEAEMIRSMGGCVVHMKREGCVSDGHASEAGVEFKTGDYCFLNNGALDDVPRDVLNMLVEIDRLKSPLRPSTVEPLPLP